ncbi:hypothetical protein Asulf_01903 [Archaeoglobus sulfaticallidus PM70-1]|uniref:Major facilitator superfamily (MFS) profile domain-containing protein n=1 Tax=Archaeoglobus sulfaticallidus PM70-1 TaxID=387631 RepID=N0BE16_9EURY|nr:MFS transporter [Archaeoglobus sulfaticallidus]AGK61869.1 hypothetical protein Asulf_01903 [Archaeoglobus sulfaticallidus PM70-1]
MRKIYALSFSLLPLMISTGMIYSILPIYISKELGAEEIHVGLLFTTGAVTGAIVSILLGKVSDRFGRKPLILLSQFLFAITMLLYSTINHYIYAFPIHALEGFAWATASTSAPALVADFSDIKNRGEAMGVYNTAWNLGWVIGPLLGGTLAQVYGFRIMLRFSFIMIIFGMVLTAFTVEEVRSKWG